MGEICAILKIRCQDQDQAQKDFGRTLFIGGINMHSEKTTIRLAAVDMDELFFMMTRAYQIIH